MTHTQAPENRRVWTAANFYVAFKCDQMGKTRETPFYWRPETNDVQLSPKPDEKETFVRVRSTKQADTEDVHIALRPNFIGLLREDSIGWQNVIVEERCVRVTTNNGVFVTIPEDGSFRCDSGDDVTTVERSGRVIKQTQYVDAIMSPSGADCVCRPSQQDLFGSFEESSEKQPPRMARRVWQAAEFYMAFNKDKFGNARNQPFHWKPERAGVQIDENPDDKEAFIRLKSTKGADAEDVHIALRPDFIALLRENAIGWKTILVHERDVRVMMADGVMIRIDLFGSVVRCSEDSETEVSHLTEVRKWTGDQLTYMSPWGDDFGVINTDRGDQ
ncbi:conserved hypothetical protein [Rhodobacteraceae bacterium KLH11]|nr:conserved hypothetical protein [Rhodobacteraceae bacterium KLH11]